MSISVNGQSRVPPGFRFHPTEEELLNYYLRKKVACETIDLDVIRDVDLNKLEPWDIQEKCRIGSTPQNDWYFFSHKDKKYPTGTRTNRATAAGFWKATGRDKVIFSSFKRIGMRKTLVFYKGRAPHGQKSDWIMHEYRLDEHQDTNSQSINASSSCIGEAGAQEEGWVVCRVFKKKHLLKAVDSPKNSSIVNDDKIQKLNSSNGGALDQILQYMSRSCKQEGELNTTNRRCFRSLESNMETGLLDRFMKLPPLESSSFSSLPNDCPPELDQTCSSQTSYPSSSDGIQAIISTESAYHAEAALSDWATVDRLVASHLNGESETCFDEPNYTFCSTNKLIHNNLQDYHHGDIDLWTFTQSSASVSDHLCQPSRTAI